MSEELKGLMTEWRHLQAHQDRCEDRGDNQESLDLREARLAVLEDEIDRVRAIEKEAEQSV